jgi:uncharacterized protein (DUF1330 family)
MPALSSPGGSATRELRLCSAIEHVDITDPERYMDDATAVVARVQAVGGRVVAAGGAAQVEGPALPNQNVVIELPDEDTAVAWYRSAESQRVDPSPECFVVVADRAPERAGAVRRSLSR